MHSVQSILAGTPVRELLREHPFSGTVFESVNLPPPETQTLAEWLAATPEARFLEFGMSRRSFAGRFVSVIQKLEENAEEEEPLIESLTIRGGHDKNGAPEKLELVLYPGDTVCLVGPTGAGKSRLLADIECLAQRDTVTGREVTLSGRGCGRDRGSVLIAQLSQSMNFVTDLPVKAFLKLHGESVGRGEPEALAEKVLAEANALAGERFSPKTLLTQLSGGQTRALMIADIAFISCAPILLIDEIENAGIDKRRAMALLRSSGKILLLSTHDPVLALSCSRLLQLRCGAVVSLREQTEIDRRNASFLADIEAVFNGVRDDLRLGREPNELTWDSFKEEAHAK